MPEPATKPASKGAIIAAVVRYLAARPRAMVVVGDMAADLDANPTSVYSALGRLRRDHADVYEKPYSGIVRYNPSPSRVSVGKEEISVTLPGDDRDRRYQFETPPQVAAYLDGFGGTGPRWTPPEGGAAKVVTVTEADINAGRFDVQPKGTPAPRAELLLLELLGEDGRGRTIGRDSETRQLYAIEEL